MNLDAVYEDLNKKSENARMLLAESLAIPQYDLEYAGIVINYVHVETETEYIIPMTPMGQMHWTGVELLRAFVTDSEDLKLHNLDKFLPTAWTVQGARKTLSLSGFRAAHLGGAAYYRPEGGGRPKLFLIQPEGQPRWLTVALIGRYVRFQDMKEMDAMSFTIGAQLGDTDDE